MNTETPKLAPPKQLRFTMDVELPCGCHMTQAVVHEFHGTINESNIRAVSDSNANTLSHWFKQRAPRHRCELVTEDNPNGLEGFTPRGGVTA